MSTTIITIVAILWCSLRYDYVYGHMAQRPKMGDKDQTILLIVIVKTNPWPIVGQQKLQNEKHNFFYASFKFKEQRNS